MNWPTRIVILLALFVAGWLTFDGIRAFVVGDYVTPSSGEYAGQLGPWARLVESVGLDPRSNLIKGVHVGLGVLWLVTLVAFVRGVLKAWGGMVLCAVLSLWYLPFGTLLGAIQLALLLRPSVRRRFSVRAVDA